MKRWHYLAMAAAAVAAGGYFYVQDGQALKDWFSSSSSRKVLTFSGGSQWHTMERLGG